MGETTKTPHLLLQWCLSFFFCIPEIFSSWHLLSIDSDIDILSVHLGKKATNETNAKKEQIFSVEKMIIHPNFDSSSYNNDIGVYVCAACVRGEDKAVRWFRHSIYICVCLSTAALLKIRGRDGDCAEKSASVRVVCLPPLHTQLPAGFQCTVAGYGRERHRTYRSMVDQLHHQAPNCLNYV